MVEISASPAYVHGHISLSYWLIPPLGLLLTLLLALYVGSLFSHKERAEQLVLKRTAALQESEERFRTMFEKAADVILVADIDTKKFLMGNEMACEMLGYSPEEIRQLWVMDLHPPEALAWVLEGFERQVKQETKMAPDLPVIRKDGSVFYADVKGFPMIIQGKPYLVGVFRDISARRQAEQDLRETNAKLEILVPKGTNATAKPP